MDTQVLIAGAGPTGLTLAIELARRGIGVRIVDKAEQFPFGSRGDGLQPRTLEVFEAARLRAMRSFHSSGPVMWTLEPLVSTATVTGISTTSNS